MPESFERMCKDVGIERITKALVERGVPTVITEHEYTAAWTDFAAKRYSDKPRDVAFSKLLQEQTPEGETCRRGLGIVRNFPVMAVVEPMQVDKATVDPKNALAALNKLAEEEVRRNPTLSTSQAFVKAYAANPRLAQVERNQNRPRATAIYQSGQ